MDLEPETKFARPLPPKYTRIVNALQQPALLQQQSYYNRATQWRQKMRDAYDDPYITLDLAKAALEIDKLDTQLQGSITYRGSVGTNERELTASVLHLMHQDLKVELIESNYAAIAKMQHLPRQLSETLAADAATYKTKDEGAERRPVLYMHFHVNDKHEPPTPNEFQLMVEALQCYHNHCAAVSAGRKPNQQDTQTAQGIDEAVLAPSSGGKPRVPYKFKPKQPRYAISKDSGKVTPSFLTGLQQFIFYWRGHYRQTLPSERDDPVANAVSETGWTATPNQRRFQHHEHGLSGNSLMNVIDAATRFVLPNKTYRMRWIIVLEIVGADQAAPAERILSRLASSYSTCGGTNQVLAGASVKSAVQFPVDKYIQQWTLFGGILHKSVYDDNGKIVDGRYKEAREAQATIDDWARLESVTKDGKEIMKRLEQVEKEQSEWDVKLQDEFPAWLEMLNREIRGIKLQKAMADAAEELSDIWP